MGGGDPNFWDFFRDSSLQLVSKIINEKKIQGSVAEAGVNRGAFAAKINSLFPDKRLHLFDTFEGFPEKYLEIDKKMEMSNGKMKFKDTNTNIVLKNMKYPQNVFIHKGCFPDTAKCCKDELFCFVSLDFDLYQPTLEGLRFFYPRLSKEGYMFVHDYNNDKYMGVRKAIDEFEEDYKIFPLSDTCGTAVIMK
jgi:O-methyltransferase